MVLRGGLQGYYTVEILQKYDSKAISWYSVSSQLDVHMIAHVCVCVTVMFKHLYVRSLICVDASCVCVLSTCKYLVAELRNIHTRICSIHSSSVIFEDLQWPLRRK